MFLVYVNYFFQVQFNCLVLENTQKTRDDTQYFVFK